jgi:DNA-binding LacI/PurR family transcriptional regulator
MSIVKIAQHAGVSTATVSRVLNNLPHVGAETARQVRASAAALNYTIPTSKSSRHRSDRHRYAHRQSSTIAILTLGQTRDWLQLPVMANAVSGITRGAREFNLRLILDEQLNWAKPTDVITNRGADGAIVFVPSSMKRQTPRQSLASIKRHLPVVWVMGASDGAAGVDHICADHQAIAFMALEYLKDRGCQDVAFLTQNPDWHLMRTRGHSFAAAALDGQMKATSYILGEDPAVAELFGPRTVMENNLQSLVARLVQANPRPTGLFSANDATTVQIYPILQSMGIQPERDITIVSCDNEDIRLSGLNPRPTSIDAGGEEAGWRAVHRLMERMENADEPPILISVAPKLVVWQGGKAAESQV